MKIIKYANGGTYVEMHINQNNQLYIEMGDLPGCNDYSNFIEISKEEVISLIQDLQAISNDMS